MMLKRAQPEAVLRPSDWGCVQSLRLQFSFQTTYCENMEHHEKLKPVAVPQPTRGVPS